MEDVALPQGSVPAPRHDHGMVRLAAAAAADPQMFLVFGGQVGGRGGRPDRLMAMWLVGGRLWPDR